MRLLSLTLLCLAFAGFHAVTVTPTAGSRTAERQATAPPPAPQTPEQKYLARLRDPETPIETCGVWIQHLGAVAESQEAVAELIRWLEFSPDWFRPDTVNTAMLAEECPAQRILAAMGPRATPQLVNEYVIFFENTNPGAWRGRVTTIPLDDDGKPSATQNPCYRLSSLAWVMSGTPATAKKAVEVATERMKKDAADDRVVRACRELIGRIKAQFPEAEHPKLFPAALLAN